MARTTLWLGFILLLSTTGAAPAARRPIELIAPGNYIPVNTGSADNETYAEWWSKLDPRAWQALCPAGSGFRLVPAAPRLRANAPDEGGFVVTVPACPEAVVLIRGLAKRRQPLQSARVERLAKPVHKDTTWRIVFGQQTYILSFEDAVGLPLQLAGPNGTQVLRDWKTSAASMPSNEPGRNDWGYAGSVQVLWAGDLDGDARLDLLLRQGDAEMGSSVELFMSTHPPEPPGLKLTDSYDFGGC